MGNRPPEPDSLKAIVFDTNAFKGASLDLGFLRGWMLNARRLGLELWMPEPVLWELAIHVVDAIEELSSKSESVSARIRRAGLNVAVTLPDGTREEIVEELMRQVESLGEPLKIVGIESVAKRAIYDQVLSLPPGDRESGVRTGAVDSAWIRAVHEKAEEVADAYAIVSADRHVDKAFAHWDATPPRIFRSARDLDLHLFPTEPASKETAYAFAKHLSALVRERRWPDSDAIRPFENEVDFLEDIFDPDEAQFLGGQWADLTVESSWPDGLVGLGDVVRDRDRPLVHGMAFFLMDLAFSARLISPSTEGNLRRELLRRVVRVDVVAEVSGEEIGEVSIDGDAVILRMGERWSEEDIAYQECLDALTIVPDLAEFEVDSYVFGEDNEYKERPSASFPLSNGKQVALESSLQFGDGWDIAAYIDDHMVQLICEYDFDTWVGGTSGFNLEPPWFLRVEGDTDLHLNPYFALAEFILRKSLE